MVFSALIIFCLSHKISSANVSLPAIFGNHMVLQQNSNVNIWGWSDPNEKIKIKTSWDTTTYITTASGSAKWKLLIKTPKAGGPHTITITGRNNLELQDVMIGEVWLASGQSNMEMSMNWGMPQYAADVAAAKNNNIRFFQVQKTTAPYPQDDLKGQWVVSDSNSMKGFSTVAYFFGNQLNQQLQIPVGLINSSWGGTPAEVWTPKPFVDNSEILKQEAAQRDPSKNNGWPVTPGVAFNAMIAPLIPYEIAGAIWYQGESNAGNANHYQSLFTTMIGAWRNAWQKDFPFYYVQIAPYAGYGNNNIAPLLRDAQTKSLSYPKTGMVVIHDLVDNINDIHPKMKKEVGLRLANVALSEHYKKQGITFKSPQFKSMKVEKNKIRLYFDDAPNGLLSKNGASTDFVIAGADQQFVPATAKIEGNTIVVSDKNINDPVAVRFGFTNSAMPNVFSAEGLPVNIFRTDDWPVDSNSVKK